MSWGISENATEKEKVFSIFADDIAGMNSCGVIDYSAYSEVFDIGRRLADKEYQQGRADAEEQYTCYDDCDSDDCSMCCRWDRLADCYHPADKE